MRILTWNINSIRLRIGELLQVINQTKADVVCLQETKVLDHAFPTQDLHKAGYRYIEFFGEKSYNGVATISKLPVSMRFSEHFGSKNDARHLALKVDDDIEIHNFYVPAGGDEIDPTLNPKFAYKLKYMDNMIEYFKRNKTKRMVMVGDLNVAHEENDVWSHKQLLKVISHTPIEIDKMYALKDTLGWIDTSRHFVPSKHKLYSWWSYRNRDWRKSDRGRRLDHIWTTPDLKKCLKNGYIIKDARDLKKPSDHVPVILDLL